jgi:hypothetical protein
VSNEPIPARMTELLSQLDQPVAKTFAGDGSEARNICRKTE